MERTCGDGNRAVSRGVNGVETRILKTGILRCEIAVVEAILCSAARFAISAFCMSVTFAYDSLFDYEVFWCSLCMHLPSLWQR